jgi:putative membrane protein
MAGIRFFDSVICFAATAMLFGAPALAQDTMGAAGSSQTPVSSQVTPGSSQATPGAASSGSMSHGSAGSMQGGSASGMGNTSTTAGGGKLDAQDKKFMQTAMEGNMAEIQLGQLALQKASSDQVKQFAQHMIDDHTKLSSDMKPLALRLGVEPPTALSSKHKAVEAKLQGLSGAQFDQAYVKAMVDDHQEDDQLFLKEQASAKYSSLKDAVTQSEPVIASHLKMAQELEKSTKGDGSSASKSSSM